MNYALKGAGRSGARAVACLRNSLLITILLGACHPSLATALAGQAAENSVRLEASHEAMGTMFTIVVYGRDRDFLAEVVEQAFQEVDRIDAQMSNYKPESELSVINREASSHAVVVEPGLFHLLQISLQRSEATGGAFDVTVGPLMKSWGFFRGRGRLPSPAELAQVLKRVGYQHIKLDAGRRTLRFDEPGVEIDLGGIAKGYAVDRAVDVLRSNGITSALVSSGMSSIYALGSPPGRQGWEISLRSPYDPRQAGDVFHLENWSLSTSGNYEKFFKIEGKNYCHIMNPHTGWPVEGRLSAAVLAATGTDTDGRSAGCFVMGVDGTRKYLERDPNLVVIFYLPDGAPPKYQRVELRSASYQIPAGSIVDIQK
jgi:thiamine biosynthesis lipoprotein